MLIPRLIAAVIDGSSTDEAVVSMGAELADERSGSLLLVDASVLHHEPGRAKRTLQTALSHAFIVAPMCPVDARCWDGTPGSLNRMLAPAEVIAAGAASLGTLRAVRLALSHRAQIVLPVQPASGPRSASRLSHHRRVLRWEAGLVPVGQPTPGR